MEFVKAKAQNLNMVEDLFKKATEDMNKKGILQWDAVYPNTSVLIKDINDQNMFIAFDEANLACAVVINKEYDRQYANAKWGYCGEDFVIIHRLCVNPNCQNKGIAKAVMLKIEKALKKKNIKSIPLDCFSQNPYAIKLYENLGYKKVAEVEFRKGLFYLYEKQLQPKKHSK